LGAFVALAFTVIIILVTTGRVFSTSPDGPLPFMPSVTIRARFRPQRPVLGEPLRAFITQGYVATSRLALSAVKLPDANPSRFPT
jgi:hypothetical protein